MNENLKKLKFRTCLKVNGLENIPNDAPIIFCANHNCLMDIFYLPCALPDNTVNLISARLLYKNEIPKRKKMVNELLNAMPIEAHGGNTYANMCISYATKLLCKGFNLCIFPEGAYIEPNNFVFKGRTGASRILYGAASILKSKPYLIPVAIKIESKKLDLDGYNPNDDIVTVSILKPIDYVLNFNSYVEEKDFNEKNRLIHLPIDKCMMAIANELKKEYKNEYIILRAKGNVVFEDASTVDVNIANESRFILAYDTHLNNRLNNILSLFGLKSG